jgi:hypothetical protein
MDMPIIKTYISRGSEQNAICVTIGNTHVWFSYQTPVAFRVGSGPLIVRQNDWGTTTGKHLNAIDGGDKSSRVTGEEFQKQWLLLTK